MDAEEYSLLKATNIDLQKQVAALQEAVKKLTEPAGPQHVNADDMSSGRVRVSPEGKHHSNTSLDIQTRRPFGSYCSPLSCNKPPKVAV